VQNEAVDHNLDAFDDLDVADLRSNPGLKWAEVPPGVLPAWIADMDFPPAPQIRAALLSGIDAGLTYPTWDDRPDLNPLAEAFAERMRHRYGFAPDPSYVREFSELIQALQTMLQVATRPGDAVAIHTPTYPPFLQTLTDMDRRLVPIPLTDNGDGWRHDTDRLAEDVVKHNCRALILVNPHNPTGRVFHRDELVEIAEIAVRHDLLVISDEIHADLTHEPHRHIPFASLGPEVADRTVTLTSATKAFNLAGLRCSVAHVGDRRVRKALEAQPPFIFGQVSTLAVRATLAAWQDGDDWLATLRTVLDRNRRRVAEALPAGVGYRLPEATYLAWLDFRELGLGSAPRPFLLDNAKVLLSNGPDFGPGGEGFVRLNFATSGSLLEEILHRIKVAVEHRSGA
jgi:cysteine-S-conjugate beta-lyase